MLDCVGRQWFDQSARVVDGVRLKEVSSLYLTDEEMISRRKQKVVLTLQAMRTGGHGVGPGMENKLLDVISQAPPGLTQDGLVEYVARNFRGRMYAPKIEFVPAYSLPEPKEEPALSLVGRKFSKHGLSARDIKRLVDYAEAKCQGCGESFTEERRAVIDHCHTRGPGGYASSREAVRGLLCHHCNHSLTKHMTPEKLRSLADYLEIFESAEVPAWAA